MPAELYNRPTYSRTYLNKLSPKKQQRYITAACTVIQTMSWLAIWNSCRDYWLAQHSNTTIGKAGNFPRAHSLGGTPGQRDKAGRPGMTRLSPHAEWRDSISNLGRSWLVVWLQSIFGDVRRCGNSRCKLPIPSRNGMKMFIFLNLVNKLRRVQIAKLHAHWLIFHRFIRYLLR